MKHAFTLVALVLVVLAVPNLAQAQSCPDSFTARLIADPANGYRPNATDRIDPPGG